MSAQDEDPMCCRGGLLIERVNAASAAVGAPTEPGSAAIVSYADAGKMLAVHSGLRPDEVDCLIVNMAETAIRNAMLAGGFDIYAVRGLIAQSFLAGVFAGRDAS